MPAYLRDFVACTGGNLVLDSCLEASCDWQGCILMGWDRLGVASTIAKWIAMVAVRLWAALTCTGGALWLKVSTSAWSLVWTAISVA